MFIVFLKFSNNKDRASEFMAAHNEWISHGFDDQVFLLVGSIKPGVGGAILANNTTQEALTKRIDQDPFVIEDVVRAEIIEISANKTDARLNFIME